MGRRNETLILLLNLLNFKTFYLGNIEIKIISHDLNIMTDNGGIKKGNSSSNDNTLAFPQFNVHSGQWMPNPPAQNKQETNLIVEYNQIMNNNFNSDSKASFNKKDVQIKDDSYPNANNDSFKSQNNNFNPNFHSATNRSGSFSNQNYPGSMSANNSSSNIDIRNSIDFFTKQHYKQVNLLT